MVVWIVGIVMVAQVIDSYLKAKAKAAASNALGDETQGRIDDLEERIRVLERIVTENKHDLKREINELR
jgi:hypothetical protein